MILLKHLYTHDSSFTNIDEECVIDKKTGLTVGDYLQGRCHLFALALNHKMGYPVVSLMDADAVFDEGTEEESRGFALTHAFCQLPGDLAMDARGIRTMSEMIAEYECQAWEMVVITDHAAKDIFVELQLGDFDPGERESLSSFIDQMVKLKLHEPGMIQDKAKEVSQYTL